MDGILVRIGHLAPRVGSEGGKFSLFPAVTQVLEYHYRIRIDFLDVVVVVTYDGNAGCIVAAPGTYIAAGVLLGETL